MLHASLRFRRVWWLTCSVLTIPRYCTKGHHCRPRDSHKISFFRFSAIPFSYMSMHAGARKPKSENLFFYTTAIRGTFEPKILRPFCPHAGWRVIAQVPNLCWKRHSNTISRLVLLVGMMPHCRKRSGVKISADSVTSIDTVQRQRRRSLLSTILGYC